MNDTASVVGRRVLGLAFFLVLALFLAVSFALFDKSFTTVVEIDLVTDSTGSALAPDADINYPVLKDAGLLLTFSPAVRGVAALGTVDWAAR
ncbi:hypothetical protein [Rhodococcus koreensis]|uniref:hypothetical protein n=1 Tax=Rhodococcus koreensis TaxID=99653 RepID=UPI0036DB1B70